eukprot:COSAG05_NODE_15083_length_379_cov_0.525000_1_plen_70_part_10
MTNEKGEDQEVPGPDPVMVGPDLMTPKSLKFTPSSVNDNLFLLSTAYFFKQKTAYEILRSDWSSDVCSSD